MTGHIEHEEHARYGEQRARRAQLETAPDRVVRHVATADESTQLETGAGETGRRQEALLESVALPAVSPAAVRRDTTRPVAASRRQVVLALVGDLAYLHAHRHVEADDDDGWHDKCDESVDARRDAHERHEASAWRAHVGAVGQRDDAVRPRGEGVEEERRGCEPDDDDVGSSSRAPYVLLERVEHDDVALDGEADDDPH